MERNALNPMAFQVIVIAMLLAVFGCQNQSPVAPDIQQPILSPAPATGTPVPEPETVELACDIGDFGRWRAGVKTRVDGLTVSFYVPNDYADYVDVWEWAPDGFGDTKYGRGPVNEWFDITFPEAGTYKLRLAVEKKLGAPGRVCQDDRHYFEVTVKEKERERVCVEWETKEVPCPPSQRVGTELNCKPPEPCFEEVCVRWEWREIG